MIALKCKMCGGNLEVNESVRVAECEYCGTRQTLPKLDDEKKISLFERANHYRKSNEFDKAAMVYENIVNESEDEAEAYWGLCLCRYGIEYVVDPKTQKRVPTCHRTQFKSVLDDSDYKKAIEYADIQARDVYREEAEYIDKIQKDILAISAKEDPFDIFICYKETDERGERTVDSVIAQDIYTALTDKGYKVFFSRITLEDKLGSAYEPYIFAALNSSKVMLVVGTRPEHYNAVWVKNEWSRYLSLIEHGKKKTIITCYKDMDAYDLPQEFIAIQGQDMGKVGAMQDLIRGVQKIIDISPVGAVSGKSADDFDLKQAEKDIREAVDAGDFELAQILTDKLLKKMPTNAIGHYYAILVTNQVKKLEQLPYTTNWQEDSLVKRCLRYADGNIKLNIENFLEYCRKRRIYDIAATAFKNKQYEAAESKFRSLGDFMNSQSRAKTSHVMQLFDNEIGNRDTYIQRKMEECYPDTVREFERIRKKHRAYASSPKNEWWYLVAAILMTLSCILVMFFNTDETTCFGIWGIGLSALVVVWNGDCIIDFSDVIRCLFKGVIYAVIALLVYAAAEKMFDGGGFICMIMLIFAALQVFFEMRRYILAAKYNKSQKRLKSIYSDVTGKISTVRNELISKYKADCPEIAGVVNSLKHPYEC